METLAQQFDDALALIGISEKAKRAQAAHKEVRQVLETSSTLRDWAVDTILIGSYARHTAIYPGKDVDVFSKMTKLDTSVSPTTVFQAVRDTLVSHYGRRATPQRRSVKILFEEDFSVDAVPAVRSVARWAVPNRNQAAWAQSTSRWVETDPERLGDLTTERNRRPTIGGQGAYVPVVKLVRQIREHHLRDAKPGGLYMEILTYYAFGEAMRGDSFAELLAITLRRITNLLGATVQKPLIDPALGTPYAPAPAASELQDAQSQFGKLAAEAERALALDRCPAAVVWRGILGKNDRGLCFPLPPGCDESGRTISAVTVNTRRGSDEARPFA
jgi:Second Messenger Oligonucleotide or Dinucleotide Synthetase domain